MIKKTFMCSGILEADSFKTQMLEKGLMAKFVLNDGARKHFLTVFDKNIIADKCEKMTSTSFVYATGEVRNYKKEDGTWGESMTVSSLDVMEIQF